MALVLGALVQGVAVPLHLATHEHLPLHGHHAHGHAHAHGEHGGHGHSHSHGPCDEPAQPSPHHPPHPASDHDDSDAWVTAPRPSVDVAAAAVIAPAAPRACGVSPSRVRLDAPECVPRAPPFAVRAPVRGPPQAL